jgi:hypothetical protein
MVDAVFPSRREFLRLAAAAGLIGPAALSCASKAPVSPTARPSGTDHVAAGLAALADVHHRGWVPGHHGAAILAGHFFCADNELDERTTRAVGSNLDSYIAARPDEFPKPAPGEGGGDPTRIVETLDAQIREHRSGGHNAIYSALALRAMRDRPELATPAAVDGICRLLEVFRASSRPVSETAHNREHPLPAYGSAKDVAEITLRQVLGPWNHVRATGASGVVHWVTHAEALITLEDLGHGATARKGYDAHRLHINFRPADAGGREPDRVPFDWLGPVYWESDSPHRLFGGTWLFGHAFKLPHSLFTVLKRVDDAELRKAVLARATKLTIPFE